MSVSIRQDSTYVGGDHWRWSVWLDGPATELDSIEQVEYVLHPTFHKPVREISDRATNFRLDRPGADVSGRHADYSLNRILRRACRISSRLASRSYSS